MMKYTHFLCLLFFCAIVLAAMTGCGSQAYQYRSENEIPEGPGVFSGKDGEFTVYDSTLASRGQFPKTGATAMDQTDIASGTQTTSVVAPKVDPEAAEEFEAFQTWKKERAEFEAFKDWKQSEKSTDEYAEFLEWKRWQEFRRWQEK